MNRLPSVIGREGEGEEELLHVLLEGMCLTVVNVVNEENEGGGGGDAKESKWREMRHSFSSFVFFFRWLCCHFSISTAAVIQSLHIHLYSKDKALCQKAGDSSHQETKCFIYWMLWPT